MIYEDGLCGIRGWVICCKKMGCKVGEGGLFGRTN